jgi:hypothetical protein
MNALTEENIKFALNLLKNLGGNNLEKILFFTLEHLLSLGNGLHGGEGKHCSPNGPGTTSCFQNQ